MKRVAFIIIFIVFFTSSIYSQLFIELNQMLGYQVGYNLSLNDDLGIRGGVGSSISFSILIYSATVNYKIPLETKFFNFYLDMGLPLAYYDPIGNKYTNTPYAGWLTGVTLRTVIRKHLYISLGISYWREWQKRSGTKEALIPLIFIGYIF